MDEVDDSHFPFWGIGSAAFRDIADEPKEGDVEKVDDGRDVCCWSLRESWYACFRVESFHDLNSARFRVVKSVISDCVLSLFWSTAESSNFWISGTKSTEVCCCESISV